MDLTKILKEGDNIYCTLYGNVTVTKVSSTITIEDRFHKLELLNNGAYDRNGECIVFPSKENRDWNTISKFKNGDVIISEHGNIAIFSHVGTIGDRNDIVFYHCLLPPIGLLKVKTDCGIGRIGNCTLASNQQKERIFKALKANWYKWNDEIGAIEKIDSFKPFDKVLVRNDSYCCWSAEFFSNKYNNTFYCISGNYTQCIPYNKETQHLIGTNQDCPDKYKIW